MTRNILIVDDSATMRKIIMRGLRQAGVEQVEFQEAGDGIEGLRALASGSFDLILSDVNMPHMNGLEFVRSVAEQIESPPPIVMITTEGSEDIVKEALARGAQGYLKKPFTPEQIRDVVGPFLQ